jgi:hypothetical protein
MRTEVISTTIIPATPGFYLLWASHYEGECLTDKAPIIAWKVILHESGTVEREPVLATESSYEGEDCFSLAVLAPDGAVYKLESSEQSSEAGWTKRAEHFFANVLTKAAA